MESYCEESRKLKLVSQCYVKPTHVANETQKERYYLRAIDLLTLTVNPMQKGHLFDTKPHNIRSDLLLKLKKALTISLVHFYPLAGQFATRKYNDEHACSLYVDYDKGPGARLIHATVDLTVSDILSCVDVHPIVASFFDLGEKSVNHDGHTRPLLSVQVTELLDGVFIGFTMNHCIADGTSLWHFISTLSEIFSQIKDGNENENIFENVLISQKPIFDTIFPNIGYGPITKFPYLEPDEFIFRYDPGPLRVRLFHFSSKSISMLKTKANEECGMHNNISSFQALCGFAWRSISRARNMRPDSEVKFSMAINARSRLEPPLSPGYFRSFFVTRQCVSKVDDLLRNGLGHAALLINQIIKMQDNQAICKLMRQCEEHPSIFRPSSSSDHNNSNKIFIAGSPNFDIYGPKFGLGKAITVRGGYVSMEDGKLIANPGREGGGSVDLEVCLRPAALNSLELDEEFMSLASST